MKHSPECPLPVCSHRVMVRRQLVGLLSIVQIQDSHHSMVSG